MSAPAANRVHCPSNKQGPTMPEPKDLPRDAIWVERTSYTKPATRDTTAPDRVTTRRDDIVEVLGKQQADLVRKLDRVWAVVLVLAALVAFVTWVLLAAATTSWTSRLIDIILAYAMLGEITAQRGRDV